jgi:hypothetical protein
MKVGDLITVKAHFIHVGVHGGGLGLVLEVHEQEWGAGKEPYNLYCPDWLVVLWSNGETEGIGEDDVDLIEVKNESR